MSTIKINALTDLSGDNQISISELFNIPRAMSNYAELRNYRGTASNIVITSKGIAGTFWRDTTDSSTQDNSVTVLVDALNRRWRRQYSGRVSVLWAGATSSTTVDMKDKFDLASAAASAAAGGLSGDVDVPAGNWYLSGPIATQANWYVDGAATILGLPSVGSETIPIHDTTYLSGRVFDFRAGTAAQIRVGAPEPWLTKYWRTISECITSLSVLSPSGRAAILAATRTSDRPDTGALSYALSASVVNDDTVNPKGGWSGYFESYRADGAGTTLGLEMDFLNLGDTKDLDPFNVFSTGITANLWLSCGGGSTPLSGQTNDISAHITTIKNSKGAQRGWVVRDGSNTGANKEVIASPYDHRWSWYSSSGTVRSYLNGKELYRTVASDTLSESVVDTSRKATAALLAPAANSITYVHNYLTHNGTSYSQSGSTQIQQKTAFSGGFARFARFAYQMSVRNSDGTYNIIEVNSGADNEFGPTNSDAVVNNGRQLNRWLNTYSKQFRPGTGAAIWTSGAGTPEGTVTAVIGSLYTRTDGGPGTSTYVKEFGTGNTGWRAVQGVRADTTGLRPALAASDVGFQYFDTTLGKPIWWQGTKWVDALGANA